MEVTAAMLLTQWSKLYQRELHLVLLVSEGGGREGEKEGGRGRERERKSERREGCPNGDNAMLWWMSSFSHIPIKHPWRQLPTCLCSQLIQPLPFSPSLLLPFLPPSLSLSHTY